MAYITRLTDINMNIHLLNDKQTIINTKVNSIDGHVESIYGLLNNGTITNDIDTHSKLDTVNTSIDTVNTSIGTTNNKLDTINNNLDTINTSIGTVNTSIGTTNNNLDTINISVGTVNTSIGTTNNNLDTINNNLDTINTSVGTVNTSIGTTNNNLDTINTSVGTVNTSVGTVNTSIGTTNNNLDTINTSVGTVNTSIGTTNNNLDTINTTLETTNTDLATVNTNLETIDTSIDITNTELIGINTSITTTNTTLTNTNNKLDTINTTIGTVNTSIGTVNTSIGTANSKLDTLDTSVGTVNTSIGSTNTKLNTLNTSIETVNTSIETTNTKLTTINTSIGAVGTSVDTVNTSVGTINTTLTSTNSTLDTINTSIGTTNTKLTSTNSTLDIINTSVGTNVKSKITSTDNSTTSTLTGNSIFTGAVENVSKYEAIVVTIHTDTSSSDSGVELYFGGDIATLYKKYSYSYIANENKTISVKCSDKYFKLRYTNGSSSQTSMSIQTYFTESPQPYNIIEFNPEQVELFGNLKTSQPHTLLDITHLDSTKNFLMMDEVITGGGASSYALASVEMTVSSASDSVIRQSRTYCTYQPGKSLCIRMTGVLNGNSNASTVTSRLGYFDENNGLFFEYSSSTMKIVKRNNATDTSVSQTNWNMDTMDGNGPSGLNISFAYNMIFYIEFAYLGVGHAKFGIYYNGRLYITHIFKHIDLTYPYMVSPNLPVRYQISSTSGSGKLICNCASVQSEGGYNIIGFPFSAGNGSSGKAISTANPNYLMSVRLATDKRKVVKMQTFSVLCSTSTNACVELYRIFARTTSPISSSSFTAAHTYSIVEYDISGLPGPNSASEFNPATTNAVLICKKFFSSQVNITLVNLAEAGGPLYLSSGIPVSSTFSTDYYVLCVRNFGGADTFYASMDWVEI
jgi:septal ring factor EnvC (AmiA/AmiB activator)